MKLKISKIKSPKLSLSAGYLYLGVWLVIIIAFGYTLYFLYENFYLAVTQSEEIILLKKEVAPDTVNIENINNVLELISDKTNTSTTSNIEDIKNPFFLSSNAEKNSQSDDQINPNIGISDQSSTSPGVQLTQ